MRVTDEKLYHLFNEYDPDCWFCTPEEAAEARARIDALGQNFDKLEARYRKIRDRIINLRRSHESTITIEHLDGTETVENYLEYKRERGWISTWEEKLIKIAGIG
jgi:hypothetical protein